MMSAETPESIQNKLRSAKSSEKSRNYFSRGYLLTPSEFVTPDVVSCWQEIKFHKHKIKVHKGLRWAKAENSLGDTAVVLGLAFDEESNVVDNQKVCNKIVNLSSKHDEELLLDYIERLSGRFVVFIISDSSVRVFNDPIGALSVFWHRADDGQYLYSSHDALISSSVGGLSSDNIRWVISHPEYKSPQGKAIPATLTPHDGVFQLSPNCFILEQKGVLSHRRFFPRKSCPNMGVEEACSVIVQELQRQVRLWLQANEINFLGLTAGDDSAATLSIGLEDFQKNQTYALTYHFFEKNLDSTLKDLHAANRRANLSQLRHLIIDLISVENTDVADRNLYSVTFKNWARFPGQALSFYRNVPYNSTFFISLGAEIGTAFYTDRKDDPLAPETLAKRFTYSKFSSDARLIKEFSDYIDYVEFKSAMNKGYDLYDLFYWEHRLGKWASLMFSELDLSTEVALPMNSRKFINALLSIPYKQRADKSIYQMISQKIHPAIWNS